MNENVRRARALMERSRHERFAVGAFNVDNQETLRRDRPRRRRSSARPCWSRSATARSQRSGWPTCATWSTTTGPSSAIEMYINLDHSPSVEAAKAGIDAGFEFIHIDLSQARKDATDAEIIEATRAVVEYAAHTTGALVESEPHYFGGSSNVHDESHRLRGDPQDVLDARGRAGIRRARPGSTPSPPPSATCTAATRCRSSSTSSCSQRIRDAIDVNISLHGGSGTPGHYFEAAARIGVSKVNLNSDMRYAYRTTLEQQLREHPEEYAIVRLMPPVVRAVQDVVEHRIDLYGSAGRALP